MSEKSIVRYSSSRLKGSNMKQVTITIEAFTTVVVADDWNGDMNSIPIKLDVYSMADHHDSKIITVVETDITTKEASCMVNIGL